MSPLQRPAKATVRASATGPASAAAATGPAAAATGPAAAAPAHLRALGELIPPPPRQRPVGPHPRLPPNLSDSDLFKPHAREKKPPKRHDQGFPDTGDKGAGKGWTKAQKLNQPKAIQHPPPVGHGRPQAATLSSVPEQEVDVPVGHGRPQAATLSSVPEQGVIEIDSEAETPSGSGDIRLTPAPDSPPMEQPLDMTDLTPVDPTELPQLYRHRDGYLVKEK